VAGLARETCRAARRGGHAPEPRALAQRPIARQPKTKPRNCGDRGEAP
jgi:hypothetical protein